MTTIAFIGLGNMGDPMAANLVKAGHLVQGFDLVPENLVTAKENGVTVMDDGPTAVANAEIVITMLPAGKHVLSVYDEIAAWVPKAALPDRFVDHRRRVGAQGPCDRGRAAAPVDRCARIGRHRGCCGRHADLHGRRLCRSLRQGRAGAEADGRPHRSLRRCRRRSGGKDLQQHDPRHLDDRRRRGIRARRKTRTLPSGALRRGLDRIGPVLVADLLLSRPRTSPRLARQPRLRSGLRRGADAEGSAFRRPPTRPGLSRLWGPKPPRSTRFSTRSATATPTFRGLIPLCAATRRRLRTLLIFFATAFRKRPTSASS